MDAPVASSAPDRELAHAIFRLALGVNMALHGAVRLLGDYGGFVAGTVKGFADTILPAGLVQLIAGAIPVVELIIGLALLLGLFTRWALAAGGLLIALLMAGMSLRQEWGTVGTQLVYSIAFFLLLYCHAPNRYALDWYLSRRRKS